MKHWIIEYTDILGDKHELPLLKKSHSAKVIADLRDRGILIADVTIIGPLEEIEAYESMILQGLRD